MDLIQTIEVEIRDQFTDDPTGHDWHHIIRVRDMSKHIQTLEGGDPVIVELAALLHDISDYKFNGGDFKKGGEIARELLRKHGASNEIAEQVCYIVDNVSYKGANTQVEMKCIEGKIVQDADRLDAIGAIGIARVFAYGGNKKQVIYDPELDPKLHNSFEEYAFSKTSSINHFYEKLLLLKDRLNTVTAKEIGNERHLFMEQYLRQFYHEWYPNDSE